VDITLLQYPQELQLQKWAHITHFVQEQCPTVGGLKDAHFIAHRTRKSPFDMSEELAFKERFWNSRAVDG
jgi:hypothetical protein